jgi:hypothetical protein
MAIDTCVQKFSGAVLKALAAMYFQNFARVPTQGLRYRLAFRMNYA